LSQPGQSTPANNAAIAHGPAISVSRSPVPQGLLVWLPALCILIGMPILALVTTKYLLLPSIKHAYARQAALNAEANSAHVYLARIPLAPPGAKAVHSGVRGIALVGSDNNFNAKIEQNKDKLAKVEAEYLNGVTISDLDKRGALEAMRARLLAACNRTLGEPAIKDLYISEWPAK
jgi:flagellar basal body-associated protein FliL